LVSGGIGTWQVISDVLLWIGPVASGDEVRLNYRLMLDNSRDYTLYHVAYVSDQYGERWAVAARTEVWTWKTYFPLMHK
jgi:hypothetical protein